MTTHRFGQRKSMVSGAGLALILFLGLSDPVASQSRRPSRSRSVREDPALPAQRAPLPPSEIDLRAIPFRIVYESLQDTEGDSNWEILLVNADGSNRTNLTNTPAIDEHYPHASPDGTKILFVAIEGEGRRDRTRSVYYMNVDGTGQTKVAENAYQPTWSGDGRSIAYLKGEYDRFSSSMTSNEGLAVYDLATRTIRDHPEDGLRMLYNLTWSPDGNWFVATSRGGRRRNLLVEATEAGIRSLSISGCRPDISPDGSRIAWGRTDHELRIGTFTPSSASDNVVNQQPVVAVNRDDKVYHVDWSPDGEYLAFSYGPSRGGQAVGQRASGWNISILEIATGKWVQVTTDGNHNKEPDWVASRKRMRSLVDRRESEGNGGPHAGAICEAAQAFYPSGGDIRVRLPELWGHLRLRRSRNRRGDRGGSLACNHRHEIGSGDGLDSGGLVRDGDRRRKRGRSPGSQGVGGCLPHGQVRSHPGSVPPTQTLRRFPIRRGPPAGGAAIVDRCHPLLQRKVVRGRTGSMLRRRDTGM